MMCSAHANNIRVVFAAHFAVSELSNETAKMEWIHTLLQHTQDTFTDGVNVDIEVCVCACVRERMCVCVCVCV